MVMDYYLTDDERIRFIEGIARDEYKLYSVREKCRTYAEYLLNANSKYRKELLSIDSGEEAIRIHGELSGITKILKAFGVGLDQSVMNEPTEIDLQNWANLSLFRLAIIRRKLNTIKIYLDKSTSAQGIVKLEVLLFTLHRFLETGDWDEDEIQMIEEDEFHDTSFLMDQSSIDDDPSMKISAPPPKPDSPKHSKKKKHKKHKSSDHQNGEKDDDNHENGQVKSINDGGDDDGDDKENKKKKKSKKESENEEDNETNGDHKEDEEDDDKANGVDKSEGDKHNNEDALSLMSSSEELGSSLTSSSSSLASSTAGDQQENKSSEKPKIEIEKLNVKKVKAESSSISKYLLSARSPNKLRRSSIVSRFTKKKSDDNREIYLKDYIEILDNKGSVRKISWKKHWIVLTNESLDIYKDEKSSTVLKAYPLIDIRKIDESELEGKVEIKEQKSRLRKSFLGSSSSNHSHSDHEKNNNSEQKDYYFQIEFDAQSTSILYMKVSDQSEAFKWITVIDGLTSVLTEIQKERYFSLSRSEKEAIMENNGIMRHGNIEWKFDGHEVKNEKQKLSFNWNGRTLRSNNNGGDISNCGNNIEVEWNGVFLKFSKFENVKFVWVEYLKEFRSLNVLNSTITWKFSGHALYRKDNNEMWNIENRLPLGLIFAVCVLSSYLSNNEMPFWNENPSSSSSSPRGKKGKNDKKKNHHDDHQQLISEENLVPPLSTSRSHSNESSPVQSPDLSPRKKQKKDKKRGILDVVFHSSPSHSYRPENSSKHNEEESEKKVDSPKESSNKKEKKDKKEKKEKNNNDNNNDGDNNNNNDVDNNNVDNEEKCEEVKDDSGDDHQTENSTDVNNNDEEENDEKNKDQESDNSTTDEKKD